MRLTIVLTLFLALNATSSVYSQATKLSMEMRNTTLVEVIDAIRQQSDFRFLYNLEEIEVVKNVNVNFANSTVEEILTDILANYDLDYKVVNQVVIITPSPGKTKNGKDQPVPAEQEKIKYTGKVLDENGMPVPYAAVFIKGSTKGVATDENGVFELEVEPGKYESLIVSSVGMITQEIKIEGKSNFTFVLKTDISSLEEVMVTGYQSIDKERATGSFNIVSRDQLDKPTSNIGTRLVGTVSGVQTTLDENGNPTFEIRGKSSLFADSKPLIVVDGFAIEGDFASINPNDVESITVLKDAAAASIWGARSANGVIVVTTKSGKAVQEGTVKVTVNSFVKVSAKPDADYLLNKSTSSDLVEFEKMAFLKRWGISLLSDSEYSIYLRSPSPSAIAMNENALGYLSDAELNTLLSKYASSNNTNQIKDLMFENPFIHQHNLNIAAASGIFNNNLSVMYEGNQTYLKGNEKETVNINYRTNAQIFKWLDFGFNAMYRQRSSSNNASLSDASTIAPNDMLTDENGNRLVVQKNFYMPNLQRHWPMESFPYSDLTYNPLTEIENRDFRTKETQSRFQYVLDIKPIDGVVIKSQAQYETFNISNKNIQGEETFATRSDIDYYTGWDRTNNTFTPNIPMGDYLDQNRSEIESWTFRNQISLDKTFGKHAINAIAGMEMRNRVTKYTTEPRAYGYDDDLLTVEKLPNGLGSYTNPNLAIMSWWGYSTTIYQNVTHSFSHYTDKYVSFYGNAAYTYDDKYTLSGSARTDASNLITDDPSYRYSPFWSIGASWQISKESFMQDAGWIDRLTLRTTFGYNGNVDRSTSFIPLVNLYPSNNIYTDEPYASISSYGNPTLRWEKTGTLDIGLDYSLFNGKLYGKLDYYHKSATDLVASVSIPAVNGTSSQKMNVGNMVNKGFEVEIGTRLPIDGNKLQVYGNLNISYNNNEITKLYRSMFGHSDLLPWNGAATTSYVEGYNANTIFGSEYAGLYNDGTEAKPNMQPKIVGKDGTLYGFGTWPADNVENYSYEQGTTVAPWIAGLSAGMKIYDFDVSFIMTGKFGHVFRRTSYNYNNPLPNQLLSEVLNGNPDEIMPLPQNDNESRYYFWDRFWKSFSYLTESANHIRMQEINVTYNLPAKYLAKTGLGNLKLYGQVNNVFSLYANDYNEDPEYPLGTYKPMPTYTFGINLSF